ncbi:MAG: hypothetical protein GX115_01750 [Ruminiclostridium sp.]|nr:hypothetical protein [Ruminiclostridium sp.]
MIFDTTCRYLPYDFLDMNTIALIPGSSAKEKAASIDKVQLTVQDAVKPIKDYSFHFGATLPPGSDRAR